MLLRSAGRRKKGPSLHLTALYDGWWLSGDEAMRSDSCHDLTWVFREFVYGLLAGLRTYDIQELRTPTQNIHFPPALSTGLDDRFNRADKTFWGVNVKKKSTFGLVLDRRSCF